MHMGKLESSSGTVGVRRSGRLANKQSNYGYLGAIDVVEDEDSGEVSGRGGRRKVDGEEEEGEEEGWEPGTGRKSVRKGVERRTKRGEEGTKRGEEGTGVMSIKQEEVDGKHTEVYWSGIVGIEYEEKMSTTMGFDAVDVLSRGLGSVNLSKDKVVNSSGSEIVSSADPQELVVNVVVDPRKEGIMKRPSVRTVSLKEKVINQSSGSRGDGDEGDDYPDDESAEEQQEIDTTLDCKDAALFSEVTKVLQEGGDLKKLKVDHLKAYLRHHGLRMSGVKAVLLSRCEDHLRFKDGQAAEIYPRSSFSINCKGDVCLGDNVLFLQNVYDSFDIACRSAKPLGKRWVAGRVVNESYGAGKQQHTFTIEVLWSTGTRPFYVLRPLQIKGRNLYRINTMRQPWIKEADRHKVLDEKHARGAEARAQRQKMLDEKHAHVQRRAGGIVAHSRTRNHSTESNRIPPRIGQMGERPERSDRRPYSGERRQEEYPRKVFVGNLNWGCDDSALHQLFSEYVKVVDAEVVQDRETGRSRGFGFVTLENASEVNTAIENLDGANFQGRQLRVNLAGDKPPPRF